jgi:Ternary complex associated domain 9
MPTIGDVVSLRHFAHVEQRADGSSFSLTGKPQPGHPPLRVRLQGATVWSDGVLGRVIATRETLLRGFTASFDRYGLPDPLTRLDATLAENIQGTQSTIHGDLNLENVLTGLGGMVWLIDFAATRDGHPLADIGHLTADILAHVVAPRLTSPAELLRLSETQPDLAVLLRAMDELAGRYSFNPGQKHEWQVALYLSCVGALKYNNLSAHQKHVLFLMAASVIDGRR